MMQLSRRQFVLLAIALLPLVLLTLFLAPSLGELQQHGSTYSRAPYGYGAWYAFMQERGTPVQRWRKPPEVLFDPTGWDAKQYQAPNQSIAPSSPVTLVQISDRAEWLAPNDSWVKQGNVLVLLGARSPATKAPFASNLDSPSGSIRIETSRRHAVSNKPGESITQAAIVSDRFGAVVWQETVGKGQIIRATTPYLAANAYQGDRANYELLATLVTQPGHPVLVDEHLHGYTDPPTRLKDDKVVFWRRDNLIPYLLRTPLALLITQAIVFLAVLIWGHRRFGRAEAVLPPVIDNSQAYIQALAGVLHKAECSEFVLETVGKAEQLEIQKALGLGTTLLPTNTLVNAWTQHTGRPAHELNSILQTVDRPRRVSSAELLKWVETIQAVRQQLPK